MGQGCRRAATRQHLRQIRQFLFIAVKHCLHRFLHHDCTAFCSAVKVAIRHLQIVRLRDRGAIADPLANDVNRVYGGEFRLAARTEIVNRLRQRHKPRPLDYTRLAVK